MLAQFAYNFKSWWLLLVGILGLALGLRLIYPSHFGDGNPYYTAAAENMLKSPTNFFFGSADSGGVTVDKPPIALWIQAVFVAVLGLNGFAVILPSILAGLGSILILYYLVKKSFGEVAGLIAAFTLATTPVTVAVNRSNNLDSLLIFALLLATLAFVQARESGKWRPLIWGAFGVGIAFNVKMLQAYLILPSLYALYFLGAKVAWGQKIIQLTVTTVFIIVLSLSWAMTVDFTPAENRPFIGGSGNNSVMGLIFGHNGLDRVFGKEQPQNAPSGGNRAQPSRNAPVGADEVGTKSPTRLFESALANEFSWLLPFGLFSLGLLILHQRLTFPLHTDHQAAMLWGGWLVTGVIYFSFSGFFHAYYLATIAPALAALVGIGAARLWEQDRLHLLMIGAAFSLTLTFQLYVVGYYQMNTLFFGAEILLALIYGAITWWVGYHQITRLSALIALLFIPSYWSVLTATNSANHPALPAAYDGKTSQQPPPIGESDQLNIFISQLNRQSATLIAPSSMLGAEISLKSDLEVLYWGGFNGEDQIYTLGDLQTMVQEGKVRYILDQNMPHNIRAWLSNTCQQIAAPNMPRNIPQPPNPMGGGRPTFYDCHPEN